MLVGKLASGPSPLQNIRGFSGVHLQSLELSPLPKMSLTRGIIRKGTYQAYKGIKP